VIPNDRRYVESHEWAKLDGDIVAVGLTDFAVKHLSDLVFIDLPEVGDRLNKGDRFGEIESVKAVEELFAPVGGEVVEVNEGLADNLDRVANNPYEDGWMIKLKVASAGEYEQLLDDAAYQKVTEAEE